MTAVNKTRTRMERATNLANQFQRFAKQVLEIKSFSGGGRFANSDLRRIALAAEIQESGQYILLQIRESGSFIDGHSSCRPGNDVQLVSQLQNHALCGLLANAGDAHQPLGLSTADSADEI